VLAAATCRLAAQEPHKAAEPAPPAAGAHAPAPAHGAGHDASEGSSNPLEFQPGLAAWTVVVFLGLLYLLGRFAWKPLLQALHRRGPPPPDAPGAPHAARPTTRERPAR